MSEMTVQDAREAAKDTAENFLDEIIEQLMDTGKASDDLSNDYPGGDSWHHENYVDKSYRLLEAAQTIENLRDYQETDSGLWQGLEPIEAVSAMAAYTYGAAVWAKWSELITEINDDIDLQELLEHKSNDTKPTTPDDEPDETPIDELIKNRVQEIVSSF